MSFNIENELLEIIERNLPSQTANALSKYLDQAVAAQEALALKNTSYDILSKEHKDLSNLYSSLHEEVKELRKNKDEVEVLKTELKKKLETIEIDKMKIHVESYTRERETMLRLVDKVFGHPNVTIASGNSHTIPGSAANNWIQTTESTTGYETHTQSKQ